MAETKAKTPGEQGGSKRAPGRKQSELEVLIRARYPLVYVVTWEEQRLLKQVLKIAARLNKKVFEWSITMGLVPA